MLSSWVELHYSAVQVLPGADGISDELDGISQWGVEAVQCFEDGRNVVVGHADVAVFSPGSPAARGPAARAAAAALGGGVERAVGVLLADDGRLRDDLGGDDVERVVVLLNEVPSPEVAREGMALRAVGAIVSRLSSGPTLVASVPETFTDDEENPRFLRDIPLEVVQRWRHRGLRHAGQGVWILPPS